jgi:hypothetical protein
MPLYSLIGIFFGVSLLSWIVKVVHRRSYMTPLTGPLSPSLLFGLGKSIRTLIDPSPLYEEWTRKYGSVYRVPYALGSCRVVMVDPKAVATFFARESWTYIHDPVSKRDLRRLVR